MKPPRPRIHGWPRLFLDVAGLSLGLALAGLAVRLTVRDRLPGLAALYYLTPGAVIAAALAVSALAAGLARRRRWSLLAAVGALLVGSLWYSQNSFPGPARPVPDDRRADIRLLFWNLGGPYAEWDALGRAAKDGRPDLAAFSEARIVGGTRFTLADNWFPSHHFWQNNDGLMVFSRWPLTEIEFGRVPRLCRWATLLVRHPEGTFRLSLADLDSNPLLSRRAQIDAWRAATRRDDEGPEIVVGDFNTPFDSVWLRDLKSTHRHAFATAGKGLHVTWPLPCPVLALDHVWVRGLLPVRCRRDFSRNSDHAALRVELDFPAASP